VTCKGESVVFLLSPRPTNPVVVVVVVVVVIVVVVVLVVLMTVALMIVVLIVVHSGAWGDGVAGGAEHYRNASMVFAIMVSVCVPSPFSVSQSGVCAASKSPKIESQALVERALRTAGPLHPNRVRRC
jgi:hypothetical protein